MRTLGPGLGSWMVHICCLGADSTGIQRLEKLSLGIVAQLLFKKTFFPIILLRANIFLMILF